MPTPPELKTIKVSNTTFHLATVTAVSQSSQHMIRISLQSEGYKGFDSLGVHDDLRIQIPEDFDATPVPPQIKWKMLRVAHAADGPATQLRALTIRQMDSTTGTVDIEIALHHDPLPPGAALDVDRHGILTTWAQQARPGQQVSIVGPFVSRIIPETFDTYLLIGDDSALPAIGRHIESLPATANVIAIVEVDDEGDIQTYESAATVDMRWVFRSGERPGIGSRLIEAVGALQPASGLTYAFIGHEWHVMTAARQILRDQVGIEKSFLDASGYWRRQDAQPAIKDRLLDVYERKLFPNHRQSPR